MSRSCCIKSEEIDQEHPVQKRAAGRSPAARAAAAAAGEVAAAAAPPAATAATAWAMRMGVLLAMRFASCSDL